MSACPPDDTFTRLIEGLLPQGKVRDLESHCDVCPTCGRTLAELARTLAPDAGDWLGERYRLLEPLGAGGMGVVYTAFDTKLRRKVAVKRLRETGAGASAERRRARFLREAQMLASLSHPNVLTVHDVGGGDRELYVVMELVDGWPMSRWISETQPPPSWRRIVDLYLEAGRGLFAAHQLGVVHRDVKPENILVAKSGRVLIGDFGLAGLTGAAGAPEDPPEGATTLTQTGTVLGTPAYMAPEQHDGKPSDALSDQFSFCVSLYESLHERRPFAGRTAAEIVAAVRAGEIALGGDAVPRAVDRVLAVGLRADPGRRYPSMDHLLGDLARARDRRPVRPLVVAMAVAAAVAVTAAAGLTVVMLGRPSPVAAPPAPAPVAAAPRSPAAIPAAPAAPVVPAPLLKVPAPPGGPAGVRAIPPGRAPAKQRLAERDPPGSGRAVLPSAAGQETDLDHLLYLADRAHGDRDGAACLAALDQARARAWPRALAERVLRRRALCEMLRGNCGKGRRLLEPLDGAAGARASLLGNCPAASFAAMEDRLSAVAVQAEEARYAGNPPNRRRDLERTLVRETESDQVRACFQGGTSPPLRCGRLLAVLAQAYQAVAESFLVAGDCQEGAVLDVMQSQVRFSSVSPEPGDPALRCRARRIFEVYKVCAAAGEEAERRCLARPRAVGAGGPPELPR